MELLDGAGFPQAHATGSSGPGVEAAAVLAESAVQCGECNAERVVVLEDMLRAVQ